MKERTVDSIFRYGLFKLRVEHRGNSCSGCYFETQDCGGKLCTYLTGACLSSERQDKNNVKFVLCEV